MDAVFQRDVVEILSRTARERGLTVVIITHALELVGELADSVIFLDADSGAVRSGSKEEVFSSAAFRDKFRGASGTGKSLPGGDADNPKGTPQNMPAPAQNQEGISHG